MPDDLPFVTGAIGVLGTKPSSRMMEECDTLLMVGSAFPYSEFLPKEGQARGVQIDIDPRMLNLRFPMELGLAGDSRGTLQALLPLLEPKSDLVWRAGIEEGMARWWKVLETRAMVSANPINPQRVFWELSPRLLERSILTCDSGSCANWYARDIKLRRGMMASLSGGLATIGPAVPYALAAKLAHPARPAIALVGDGAMQMNGLNAMITIARMWRDWEDPRLVVMVLNNRDLNLVSWEQRAPGRRPAERNDPVAACFRIRRLRRTARPHRNPGLQARRRSSRMGPRLCGGSTGADGDADRSKRADEYIIGERLFQGLPAEEKALWHNHGTR